MAANFSIKKLEARPSTMGLNLIGIRLNKLSEESFILSKKESSTLGILKYH